MYFWIRNDFRNTQSEIPKKIEQLFHDVFSDGFRDNF